MIYKETTPAFWQEINEMKRAFYACSDGTNAEAYEYAKRILEDRPDIERAIRNSWTWVHPEEFLGDHFIHSL
jgi:hypothetical protein